MKNFTCKFSENAEMGIEQTFFGELWKEWFESHHGFLFIFQLYFRLALPACCTGILFYKYLDAKKSQNASLKRDLFSRCGRNGLVSNQSKFQEDPMRNACVDEQEVLLGKASSTPLPCTGRRSTRNILLPSSRHHLSILLPVLPYPPQKRMAGYELSAW